MMTSQTASVGVTPANGALAADWRRGANRLLAPLIVSKYMREQEALGSFCPHCFGSLDWRRWCGHCFRSLGPEHFVPGLGPASTCKHCGQPSQPRAICLHPSCGEDTDVAAWAGYRCVFVIAVVKELADELPGWQKLEVRSEGPGGEQPGQREWHSTRGSVTVLLRTWRQEFFTPAALRPAELARLQACWLEPGCARSVKLLAERLPESVRRETGDLAPFIERVYRLCGPQAGGEWE